MPTFAERTATTEQFEMGTAMCFHHTYSNSISTAGSFNWSIAPVPSVLSHDKACLCGDTAAINATSVKDAALSCLNTWRPKRSRGRGIRSGTPPSRPAGR